MKKSALDLEITHRNERDRLSPSKFRRSSYEILDLILQIGLIVFLTIPELSLNLMRDIEQPIRRCHRANFGGGIAAQTAERTEQIGCYVIGLAENSRWKNERPGSMLCSRGLHCSTIRKVWLSRLQHNQIPARIDTKVLERSSSKRCVMSASWSSP
jgi:hypothetical protein